MQKIKFGRTGLNVTRSAFGALPIQRLSTEEAARLLRKAYDNGINFFDTARAYSDSEEKISVGLKEVRQNLIIATKTMATTVEGFWADLSQSLNCLGTDYIDIYQFHNPENVPLADSEMYEAMLQAKKQGKIRFIGVTCHRLPNAEIALASGLYDTLQYPLSALSSDEELSFAKKCGENDIGVIAMKALCGGLLTSAALSMAYLRPITNIVPIWGFQRESELYEVLELEQNPPELNSEMIARIEKERAELSGSFCRGCGYCMPCEVGIRINWCARMPQLLRRAVSNGFYSAEWKGEMNKINECIDCGKCMSHCPYNLEIPKLLQNSFTDYIEFGKSNNLL